MNQFRADLHIHSRFSRATSKHLNSRQFGGLGPGSRGWTWLGTGDFTHPGWLDELKENMEEDATSGLYRLKSGNAPGPGNSLVGWLRTARPARFMLQGEISSIYKRGGQGPQST